MTLEILTFAVKVWFILLTVAWIFCGFYALFFHVMLISSYWIKATIFFSSIYCILYLGLGFYTNDFGESEEDYIKRCKEAGEDV